MNRQERQSAISRQEEILMRKKKEIEEKQKSLHSRSTIADSKIKQESFSNDNSSNSSSSYQRTSLFARARQKALLKSGSVSKTAASSSSTKNNSINDCFETVQLKEEKIIVGKEKKDSDNVSLSSSAESVTQGSSSAENSEVNASWFQEALKRARQKAQEVKSTVSNPPPSKKSRWESSETSSGPASAPAAPLMPVSLSVPTNIMNMVADGEHLDAIKGVMLTRLTRNSPAIVAYAKQVFGNTEELSEVQWKQCQDQLKMNVVFQLLQAKQAAAERLAQQGKVQYEYDSDEDIDGGTWEHKRRRQEMELTAQRAQELTDAATGKHHIGDFLPPEELQKFMEKFNAIKEGRDPDFSDYRESKLTEDNIGYRMLKSMGWTEGMGLGRDGSGITQPVNQNGRAANQGLGVAGADNLNDDDDEYEAYRKRMMLSYRFRPNPLNNPRRAYY